jgi:hypothetical protein
LIVPEVTFWAREGKIIGGDRAQIPITLPIEEFTRRWSLHILPKGYTKVRRFGGWSNRSAGDYVERSAIQLESIDAPLSEEAIHFGPFTETESISEDWDDTNGCRPESGVLNLYLEKAQNQKLHGRTHLRGDEECCFSAFSTSHTFGTMVLTQNTR